MGTNCVDCEVYDNLKKIYIYFRRDSLENQSRNWNDNINTSFKKEGLDSAVSE